ncbi:pyridoxamine 5'-phosphate oxidase-domain-containing protein [Xylaria bambusicola]|uniref:pyridoxamine 5'-phosphate oxidase-domain-containing protein n=1 Tax=Xylaria bambusicola TaxID=326684 RepID=UPI0020071F15|nr:pyridoxamine 5'-phosphate oxidase-domain-containing protein [Xylaria bambusicola]KAI0522132.1 pyridoxamine 5'-phosphate oxidase-domain-containing protein [Xylaria bambusicola]
MKLSRSIPLISLAAVAEAGTLSPPQHIFSNPPSSSGHRIPTSYESAVLGRRILALTPLGNLATTFPADNAGDQYGVEENRPAGLGGMPHSLMDYVADCEDDGNPTFLAINIETTFKNVRDGSNVSLAQQWTPPYPPDKRIKSASTASPSGLLSQLLNWLGLGSDGNEDENSPPKDMVPYSAANLPRFSLLGYIEKINDMSAATLAECFVKKHPDAKYWLPGNRIHESEFVRLVVTQIYWVGGFGDRAFIGWISPEEWKSVTREEWEKVSLPGEKKGWKEWSVETADL